MRFWYLAADSSSLVYDHCKNAPDIVKHNVSNGTSLLIKDKRWKIKKRTSVYSSPLIWWRVLFKAFIMDALEQDRTAMNSYRSKLESIYLSTKSIINMVKMKMMITQDKHYDTCIQSYTV
jgi:hypothetical protein